MLEVPYYVRGEMVGSIIASMNSKAKSTPVLTNLLPNSCFLRGSVPQRFGKYRGGALIAAGTTQMEGNDVYHP